MTDQEKINCLTSDLHNCLAEKDKLDSKLIIQYFSDFMESAGVDTDITIAVLEKFNGYGKEEARNLKIKWGY